MAAEQGEQLSDSRTENRWQIQAEAIDNTLQKHGLRTNEVSGGVDSGALRFDFRTQFDKGIEKLRNYAGELSQALGTSGIRINEIIGGIRVEVPNPDDVAVPLLDLLALESIIPEATATLGLAESGEAILHNFASSNSPHLLIAGGPECGKTTLLRTIAVSLAMNNRQSAIQMLAICPNASDQDQQSTHAVSWLPLNYLPHMLSDVAVKHTDIVDVLSFLVREVEYREEHSFNEPRIVLLVDQVDTVIERGGRQCAEPIQRLVQKGEDVGIHVVLSSRSLDSDVLSTQLLTGIPVQLFGQIDGDPARRLLSSSEEVDSRQLLGEGDFVVMRGGQTTRMQAAMINDYDLHLRLTEMYRHQAILLAQPFSTRVQLNKPKGQATIPRQNSTAAAVAAVPA